jgi:ribosome recycling factor
LDAHAVLVPFPKPTREYRDELVKQLAKRSEETKVHLRQASRLLAVALHTVAF